MKIEKCPLCTYDQIEYSSHIRPKPHFNIKCLRCGTYTAAMSFVQSFGPSQIAKVGYILSGLSRELNANGSELELTTTNFESLAVGYPVPDVNRIEEKANKFLQRLRDRTQFFGEKVEFGNIETDYPLAYAKNSHEFGSLLELLEEKRLIKFNISNMPGSDEKLLDAILLAGGWDLTNTLAPANKQSEQGFIAIWFDDLMNESVAAIEEGITEAGYRPICIKEEWFPEKIMDKALAEIRKSRFLVVDLTGDRGSVFFEAGFAHGLGVETIYVYKDLPESSPLEFYVKHYQCYKYNDAQELKEIVKNAVTARISKKQF